jgi:hypothetical protein
VTFSVVDQAAPAGPAVVSFTLMDADSDQPLLDPMNSGSTINLGTLPTRNLNVRANVSGSPIASVRFSYDGNSSTRIENAAPYALAGDTNGDFGPWTPSAGSHSLSATPYSSSGATGTAGTPLTITFTVIDTMILASVSPSTAVESVEGGNGGGCGLLGVDAVVAALLAGAYRRRRAKSRS